MSTPEHIDLRNAVSAELEKEGLTLLGAVSLDCLVDYERYSQWLLDNKHAGLAYLEKNRELRRSPELLLPGAQSALIVGLPYSQGDTWPPQNSAPRVAQYARFADYHKWLKRRCENTVESLKEKFPGNTQWKIAVDSIPILERALASKTAEGFIGKNTCYIHPVRGSFFLLAEILTTYAFPSDEKKSSEGCGTCTLCQIECPTGALSKDYEMDSGRCLSYWTIEQRGTIPEEFWPWLGKYYFGCDICQLVCPYNAEAANNLLPKSISPRSYPSLFETATMNAAQYEKYFGGTPMTRAKRSGLIRNALIAMKVTKDPALSQAIEMVKGEEEEMLQATLAQIAIYPA